MTSSSAPHETPPLGVVLIIDDNQIDQMMCARTLNRSKLASELISILDAEKALAYLRMDTEGRTNTIFLDVNLPGMSGADFLDAVRDDATLNFSANVFVMLSADLPRNLKARFTTQHHVKGFIDKPLTLDDLMRIIPAIETVAPVQP